MGSDIYSPCDFNPVSRYVVLCLSDSKSFPCIQSSFPGQYLVDQSMTLVGRPQRQENAGTLTLKPGDLREEPSKMASRQCTATEYWEED
jgi:hypothetical protein